MFIAIFVNFLQVSVYYEETALLMSSDPVKDYIPYSWISMAQVKHEYFKALAHHNMACAILDPNGEENQSKYMYEGFVDEIFI